MRQTHKWPKSGSRVSPIGTSSIGWTPRRSLAHPARWCDLSLPSLSTLIARPHPPPLRSEFPRLVLWSLPMTSAPLPYRCSLQHAKTGALTTPSQIELPLCLLFSHLPALICFRCQAISRTFARGCDRSPCRRHGVSCRKALPPAARPKRERSSEIPQTVPGEPF